MSQQDGISFAVDVLQKELDELKTIVSNLNVKLNIVLRPELPEEKRDKCSEDGGLSPLSLVLSRAVKQLRSYNNNLRSLIERVDGLSAKDDSNTRLTRE